MDILKLKTTMQVHLIQGLKTNDTSDQEEEIIY